MKRTFKYATLEPDYKSPVGIEAITKKHRDFFQLHEKKQPASEDTPTFDDDSTIEEKKNLSLILQQTIQRHRRNHGLD